MDMEAGPPLGAAKEASGGPPLLQLEAERAALFRSGAACIVFGVALLFASWDYAGAACAIAAGSICVDAAKSAALFAARLRAQVGACESLDGRRCCCRRGCCPGCYTGPTCGAPLHLYGLLVTVLVLGAIYVLANVATLWAYSSRYTFFCAGWVDEASFRSACPAYGPGGGGRAVGPANDEYDDTCTRLKLCSQLRYEYVLSALSLVLHAALVVAGSFALAAYNRLRVKVAGTPLMALVGATTGTCGGPTECGACCVPVPMPLAYLSAADVAGGSGAGAAAAPLGTGASSSSSSSSSSRGGGELDADVESDVSERLSSAS